ncbi:MAG: 5'-nucleotidase C-terminal domain-containing protein [bacterium]|nr:5'-nucleotidase C-terminal domain-containing protein [bacterium]
MKTLGKYMALALLTLWITTGSALANYTRTILHNNDGESRLSATGTAQPNYAGAARFVTKCNDMKTWAITNTDGYVMISSGDNFLAGSQYNAGVVNGVYYDALVLEKIGYDAIALGNHDFDFGPANLANFMDEFTGPTFPPYVSTNMDFSGDPDLQAKVAAGRIMPSTLVNVNGHIVGIVAAVTPLLPTISSPGAVVVDPNVTGAVQAAVDALVLNGAEVIICVMHLQDLSNDLATIPTLRDIDVVISGGGSEFLGNPGVSPVFPGDVVNPALPYPLVALDLDGEPVQVVTTPGEYKYVGRLVLEFDNAGEVVSVNPISNPVCVLSNTIDAVNGVIEDPACVAAIITPINAYISGLNTHIIATTDVPLDGRRNSVRTIETNEGDIFADALLWEGQRRAASFGVCTPNVAFQNGGGMRKDAIIPVGNVTELNTYEIAAFDNVVSVTPNIPAAQFKEMLEQSVSLRPGSSGGFLQIAGFKIFVDYTRQAQVLNTTPGPNFLNVITPGQRVRDIVLNDGTVLVRCGEIVPDAPEVCIATNAFTANSGDAIPFRGAPYTIVGVSYQQALYNYITEPTGLNGVITGAQYPSAPGQYRIVQNSFSQTFVNPNPGTDLSLATTPDALAALHSAVSIHYVAPNTPSSVTVNVSRTRPVLPGIDFNLPSEFAVNRYFTISSVDDNADASSTIELEFSACEVPAVLGYPLSANFVAVRTMDNGATWFAHSPDQVLDLGNGRYAIKLHKLSDQSRFDGFWGITAEDRSLPVELTSFDAAVIDGEIALAWSTASESAIERFELSRNGSKIAEVAAQNNATGANYSFTDRPEAGSYTYELSEVTLSGEQNVLGTTTIELTDNLLVQEYQLGAAYPNPFNPTTNIDFVLPETQNVSLQVFNPLGQVVATLVQGSHEAGRYSVTFDASDLTSGIYFYRLEAGSFSAMQKMVLVK